MSLGRHTLRNFRKEKAGADNVPREPDLHYHHAQLTGLKPGTTYYFVMASGDAISEEFHFRTAPAGDEPLKMIFGGDSRTGVDDRRQMNRLIAKMAAEDDSVLAFAHGGDYVGNGNNLDQWKTWLKDHELTTTATGRMIPLIPARGNHEGKGPLYDQVMAYPGGEEKNYFVTQLSPEIRFITLNTETDPDGPQKVFLEQALVQAGGTRWRVAQYHKPLYPAVKGPYKGSENWVQLFEKYNLALACEADGHCIKRTVPIRNEKLDPTGVVYIGEGGLGVPPRAPKTDRWYVQSPGMAGSGHHVQLLSFTTSHLTIDVVTIDGNVIDTHKIEARDVGGVPQ
ncbi:MAG: metallophosphoesterase family protein [Lentisphaeria bacterium]|nr:metallophosphoesterase family protein [Lentisphaeria bacterium]